MAPRFLDRVETLHDDPSSFPTSQRPFDRQTETIMGSISGVKPTATAIEKKNAYLIMFSQSVNQKPRGTMTRMKIGSLAA